MACGPYNTFVVAEKKWERDSQKGMEAFGRMKEKLGPLQLREYLKKNGKYNKLSMVKSEEVVPATAFLSVFEQLGTNEDLIAVK